MSPPLLIIPEASSSIASASEEARQRRDVLLRDAGTVTTVTDRIDFDCAVETARNLKEFLTEIESQRKVVKEPVLKIGRDIDALAFSLVADVKAQEVRISRLCGAFEVEERRKANEARINAENEAARLAYEAAKATRVAMQKAPNAEAGARAADAISNEAQVQILAVKAAAIAAPKPAASTLRTDICFEVTDIRALFSAEPNLVTLEPNGTAIRAIIKANPNIILPGVKHWTESKLNTR